MLQSKNEGIRMLENSVIKFALAVLSIKIDETQEKLNSIVNLTIVLNTTNDNLNKKNNGKNEFSTMQKPKNLLQKTKSSKTPTKDRPNSFNEQILQQHNNYRKKHKAPALVYNKKVSR